MAYSLKNKRKRNRSNRGTELTYTSGIAVYKDGFSITKEGEKWILRVAGDGQTMKFLTPALKVR